MHKNELFSTKINLIPSFIALFLLCSSPNGDGSGYQDDVITNLEVPWAIDFLPDGRMIFTERSGSVKIYNEGATRTVGKINVAQVVESGLLGIAIDPQFSQNNYVYLYYSYQNGGIQNRISRFTFNDSLQEEYVLLDDIPGANIHNGGRLKFGPDGYLYATTGDAGNPEVASDTENFGGKILRMKKDGSAPQDNPFGNQVWAKGLRDPQGIAWQDTVLYASEHGPQRYDAIRKIERGMDYGWPQKCDETPSVRCYTDFTLAPSGIAIMGNYLYVAGLRGNQLRKIDLSGSNDEELLTTMGRLRDVVLHNGILYVATSNRDGRGNPGPEDDRIFKYEPSP